MYRGTTVCAVVTIAVIVSGCDPVSRDESQAAEDHGFTVRDSAGIEVVENHAPKWPAGEFWTIDPEPQIVLADDSARLDWTAGIARLADGRVAVLFARGSTRSEALETIKCILNMPVRRGKARFPGGCESHPANVASAVSGQSGSWR